MELQLEEGYDVDTSCEEYLLLQAYCTRRSSQKTTSRLRGEGPFPPQTPGLPLVFQGPGVSQPFGHDNVTEKKNIESGPKVTVFGKKMRKTVRQPLAPNGDIHSGSGAEDDGSDLTGVTDRLAQIADGVQIGQASRLEADSPESPEDVIQKLVELLKSSGDQLNEEIQRNQAIKNYLQSTFTYALFEQVTSRLQEVVSGGRASRVAEPQDRLERQQIAVAFEVTSRLSAVDVLPMSRAMGYGTRYVQIHHSSWVRQQGGWKKAFESEDID